MQPSPYDVWAAKDIVDIIRECEVTRPEVLSRFLVNRLFPNTILADEVTDALADFDLPIFNTAIRNRTEYAKSARMGRTVLETKPASDAASDIRKLADEVRGILEGRNAKRY